MSEITYQSIIRRVSYCSLLNSGQSIGSNKFLAGSLKYQSDQTNSVRSAKAATVQSKSLTLSRRNFKLIGFLQIWGYNFKNIWEVDKSALLQYDVASVLYHNSDDHTVTQHHIP